MAPSLSHHWGMCWSIGGVIACLVGKSCLFCLYLSIRVRHLYIFVHDVDLVTFSSVVYPLWDNRSLLL